MMMPKASFTSSIPFYLYMCFTIVLNCCIKCADIILIFIYIVKRKLVFLKKQEYFLKIRFISYSNRLKKKKYIIFYLLEDITQYDI